TLIHTVLGLLLLGVVAVVPGAPQQLPYQNPSLSVEERVEDLLGRMTVQEKALQLASFFPNANVRLGIPHIQAGEALHGVTLKHATSFPQAIAMGSTWDPDLIERMANVIAEEARAFGVHHVYSPMIGVVRDPRWGRTEESYGEDPYLVSRMAVAFIKGLQGVGDARFDSNHIIATAKHFVADGEPVAGLNGAPMDISERRLHEIFLPPFKAAVEEAGVGSIMPAHHSLNGVPCHSNHYLLVEVLREGYGFDGMIVCDNNDVLNLVTFMRVADSKEAAARLALEVGIDTELAWEQGWDTGRAYGAPLVNAVKNGTIPVELLDRAVRNVLSAKFRLGLFDDGREILAWRDFERSGDKGKADYVQTTYSESVRGEDPLNEYFERADRLGTPRDDLEQVLADPEHDTLALEVARKASRVARMTESFCR
ncbi:MAG: glycoside hydrolase family 3 N-terminal domain-containing protein, partial [Vicinamibacteria bacterium]